MTSLLKTKIEREKENREKIEGQIKERGEGIRRENDREETV